MNRTQHAGIGTRGVLPRAVDVEESQRTVSSRSRNEIPTHSIRPAASARRRAISGAASWSRPWAASRYRRRPKTTPRRPPAVLRRCGGRAQHVEGAVDIDFVRGHRIVDRARHGRNRRQVKHDVRPANHRNERSRVANIHFMELDSLANLREIALVAGQQVVDHRDRSRRRQAGSAPASSR